VWACSHLGVVGTCPCEHLGAQLLYPRLHTSQLLLCCQAPLELAFTALLRVRQQVLGRYEPLCEAVPLTLGGISFVLQDL